MTERDRNQQADAAETPGISRREFVSTAAATGAAFMIVPRHVLGRGMTAPSDLVNVAVVGINGMGSSNALAVMSQNIVAICDCDDRLLEGKLKQWQDRVNAPPPQAGQGRQGGQGQAAQPRQLEPSKSQLAANEKTPRQNDAENLKRFMSEQVPKLKKYRDYRKMLEQQKDIDGVIVATPDHMHAIIASAAMDAGKHVYVQKPLCWSVHEARHLTKKAAEKKNLVTQMGNQGHSGDHARTAVEFIQAGGLGEIKEVHVWTNRPLGYWPQGVPRPAPLSDSQLSWNNSGVERRLAAAMKGNYPVPDTLGWDLFLGVAPDVEYHPIYHPFNWRGWVDWGQGALGDMGAHLIDHPVWSLKLGLPTVIETISTPFNKASYPHATTTYYEFAARGNMPAVKMTWYDGGFMPPKPDELADNEKLNGEGGILYIGTKGKMLQDTYGNNPRLIPQAANDSFVRAPETLPRIAYSTNGHEMNWVNTIKGTDKISSPFSYAAHLNEIMLLGVASLRAGNLKLHYDGPNMRFTNSAANEFLTRTYRQGYSL